MYLILIGLAAIIASLIFYIKKPDSKYKMGTLCLIYWGATIMWTIDHVMAFISEGGPFFEISRDATLLGVSVVILGLVIWLMVLFLSNAKSNIEKIAQPR